ncbi:MAG TPA: adenosylcobinamide-phosphate synthase CbiB, partial [Actinomycetota bacterium]|nr:adenosylcobinamide-phosphate synthase CbiB [Actinomycetota bacterium]
PARLPGVLHVAVLAAGAGGAAALGWRLAGRWRAGRVALWSLVVWAALGGRSLERAAEAVAAAVESGDLAAARRLLPALAGRDPGTLGAAELCRAGVESVAENTADAVTGPLFWGAVAGPVGVAVYRAVNTLDAMVGHRNERYEHFGWASARLDDVLTWPAARLAAWLAVLLAPVAGGDRSRAWATLRRDGAAHPSPNAGRLEAAFAGGLGLTLGGVNSYGGRPERRPLLGDGRPPGAEDLRRAARLSRATGAAATGLCAAAAWAVSRLRPGARRRLRALRCLSWCSDCRPTTVRAPRSSAWLAARRRPDRRHRRGAGR